MAGAFPGGASGSLHKPQRKRRFLPGAAGVGGPRDPLETAGPARGRGCVTRACWRPRSHDLTSRGRGRHPRMGARDRGWGHTEGRCLCHPRECHCTEHHCQPPEAPSRGPAGSAPSAPWGGFPVPARPRVLDTLPAVTTVTRSRLRTGPRSRCIKAPPNGLLQLLTLTKTLFPEKPAGRSEHPLGGHGSTHDITAWK